jgi:hypothetical protein
VTTKRKVTKPKHVTETGWAVWNLKQSAQLTPVFKYKKQARDAYSQSIYFPFYGRARCIRCLRTTAKGEL